ncbi:lysine transporter LysE [Actinomadura sp. NBRC 104425]|uniref:LysE family translocator n=1 Tax=Actinomadura sp. NBRC 104425 TaxID=3032204 RepID=UPI0024A49B5C|nr:LysE family translocator [Actinomadura sp. NBRC 104425]GLZ10288.1 lysine transporter LysE [Actinomadura sp. NBRC 104425]
MLTAYLGLCLLITLTPGLDTAVVTRSVLLRGTRAGMLTAAGCALGLLVHATAVALGLATLLARSAVAFEAVKLTGAALLAFLGLRALWDARRHRGSADEQPPAEPAGRPGRGERWAFAAGLLTNLTNPKATLFFLAALPQFLPDDPARALPVALGLAAIAVVFSMAGLGLWALGLGRVRRIAMAPRFRRIQERVLGVTLIGLGVRVATE